MDGKKVRYNGNFKWFWGACDSSKLKVGATYTVERSGRLGKFDVVLLKGVRGPCVKSAFNENP